MTKHDVWGLVESFKTSERCFSITTHDMIEADTLCNRVGIMANGQLRCIGNQQRLKARFGDGYKLICQLTEESDKAVDEALKYIHDKVDPTALIMFAQIKTLRIQIDRSIDLTVLFKILLHKDSKTIGCIQQWALEQSSLEDVFVNVCEAVQ